MTKTATTATVKKTTVKKTKRTPRAIRAEAVAVFQRFKTQVSCSIGDPLDIQEQCTDLERSLRDIEAAVKVLLKRLTTKADQ